MAKVNVSVPQGTRDFGPDVVRKRNYIFNTIRSVFELYGFEPLETPAMENIETLMGKYGEEGDKLIFRILDSGNPFQIDFFKGLLNYLLHFRNIIVHANPNIEGFKGFDFLQTLIDHPDVIPNLAKELYSDPNLIKQYLSPLKNESSGKALKYDLTIPFARYVAMNHGQLTFPFKRYQIQPVWRADRPQKGRYREFYQCDADVAGSISLLTEVELLKVYDDVFGLLKIPNVEIKINSRSTLKAFAALLGDENKLIELATIIDKLDKVGKEKTKEDLLKSFGHFNINNKDIVEKFLNIEGGNNERLKRFFDLFGQVLTNINPEVFGRTLLIIQNFEDYFKNTKLTVDFTLARGLTYYTGLIVEVKCTAVKIGSIGGGGAYHNLTELFGVSNMPGVGISFGVDRIYDVMEELNLFPKDLLVSSKILFLNLGLNESMKCLELAEQLRKKGIASEIYPDITNKRDKQFKYAEKKNIPYVIIMGSKELEDQTCVVKDIRNGEQQTVPAGRLTEFSFI